MADAIALLVLGAQYALAVLALSRYLGTDLPLEAVVAVFVAYARIGIAVWHQKKEWDAAVWAKLSLFSVIAAIACVGVDSLLGYSEGAKPIFTGGGLLGFPLTILFCPPFIMISVAGLARAALRQRNRNPS
jgi:peptidoglycan biosynthesis protein MviN/MurJ (putative lipid II flippase)